MSHAHKEGHYYIKLVILHVTKLKCILIKHMFNIKYVTKYNIMYYFQNVDTDACSVFTSLFMHLHFIHLFFNINTCGVTLI